MQRSFEQHSVDSEVREEAHVNRRRVREDRRASQRDFYDAQRNAKKEEELKERCVFVCCVCCWYYAQRQLQALLCFCSGIRAAIKAQYEREIAARRAQEQEQKRKFEAAKVSSSS